MLITFVILSFNFLYKTNMADFLKFKVSAVFGGEFVVIAKSAIALIENGGNNTTKITLNIIDETGTKSKLIYVLEPFDEVHKRIYYDK